MSHRAKRLLNKLENFCWALDKLNLIPEGVRTYHLYHDLRYKWKSKQLLRKEGPTCTIETANDS